MSKQQIKIWHLNLISVDHYFVIILCQKVSRCYSVSSFCPSVGTQIDSGPVSESDLHSVCSRFVFWICGSSWKISWRPLLHLKSPRDGTGPRRENPKPKPSTPNGDERFGAKEPVRPGLGHHVSGAGWDTNAPQSWSLLAAAGQQAAPSSALVFLFFWRTLWKTAEVLRLPNDFFYNADVKETDWGTSSLLRSVENPPTLFSAGRSSKPTSGCKCVDVYIRGIHRVYIMCMYVYKSCTSDPITTAPPVLLDFCFQWFLRRILLWCRWSSLFYTLFSAVRSKRRPRLEVSHWSTVCSEASGTPSSFIHILEACSQHGALLNMSPRPAPPWFTVRLFHFLLRTSVSFFLTFIFCCKNYNKRIQSYHSLDLL